MSNCECNIVSSLLCNIFQEKYEKENMKNNKVDVGREHAKCSDDEPVFFRGLRLFLIYS